MQRPCLIMYNGYFCTRRSYNSMPSHANRRRVGWPGRLPSRGILIIVLWTILPHKVKTQYLHFRSYVGYFLLSWKILELSSRQSTSSITKGNIYYIKYMHIKLLVWKLIDEKFDINWMYLLCFIFVDTAFLLCRAALLSGQWRRKMVVKIAAGRRHSTAWYDAVKCCVSVIKLYVMLNQY